MRIGVLTGGGDCPGLNAVIRAVVRKGSVDFDDEFIGFLDAWDGVLDKRFIELTVGTMRGMLPRGGTIIGTRRGSPFDHDDGPQRVRDVCDGVQASPENTLLVANHEDDNEARHI